MTYKVKTIRGVLRNPPQKKGKCPRCFGDGFINCRGMISSDTCTKCDGSGKVWVNDYDKWEKEILRVTSNKTN